MYNKNAPYFLHPARVGCKGGRKANRNFGVVTGVFLREKEVRLKIAKGD